MTFVFDFDQSFESQTLDQRIRRRDLLQVDDNKEIHEMDWNVVSFQFQALSLS